MNPGPRLRPALARYLDETHAHARIDALAGDASSRQFWRLVPVSGQSLVIMDYGEPFEGVTDDVRLNRIFAAAGLRVPQIVAVAAEAGCLVLEDLGDELLEKRWRERPDERAELLARAVVLAADVAAGGTLVLADSERAGGPALDAERFRFEMEFFRKHYVAALRGTHPTAELEASLTDLADAAAASPRSVLCHRDFHSRNLLVMPTGELAMVDIQDARWGPDTYDLASLLCDAYIDIPEAWIDPSIRRYLDRLSDPPSEDGFRERFEVVAAERMIKALGTFGYQIAVLGRRRYESAVPRTVERLRRGLPQNPHTRRVHQALVASGLL